MRQSTPNVNDLRKWNAYVSRFHNLFSGPSAAFMTMNQTITNDRSLVMLLLPSQACLKALEARLGQTGRETKFIQLRAYKLSEPCFGGCRLWGSRFILGLDPKSPSVQNIRLGWLKAPRMKDLFWTMEQLQKTGKLELHNHL